MERWKRWYHLQGRGWAREQVLAFGVASGFFILLLAMHGLIRGAGARFEKWEWWTRQPASVRFAVKGIALEVVGWALVIGRRRSAGLRMVSFGELRLFGAEIVMIVAGLVFLVRAGMG